MVDIIDFLFGKKRDPVSLAIEEAIHHLEAGRHDDALDVLRNRALKLEPGHRRALLHVGLAHMLKGEFDEAERTLSPLAEEGDALDSESAAAGIVLERVAVLRAEADHA